MKLEMTRKKLRISILIITGVLIIYFLYLIKSVLVPFLLALVLAYILNPFIRFLERHGLCRILAILGTYFSFAVIVFIIIYYGFPIIIKEVNALAETVPEYTLKLQEFVRNFYKDFQRVDIPESIKKVTLENINNFEQTILDTLDSMVSNVWNIFSGIFSIILAPVLAFYMLKDSSYIGTKLLNFIPISIREEFTKLWDKIDNVLTNFIRGHLLVAGIVGLLTTLGLSIIGMKFAIILGIIAGLADLIPYFGPILGAVPAVALALLNSKVQAFYVILVMIIVQQLESNLLSPKILGDSVGLHPLAVIFVLLTGGHFFGVLGMIIAVPFAAVIKIIINYAVCRMIS